MSRRRRCQWVVAILALSLASGALAQGPTVNRGGLGVPELRRNETSLGTHAGRGRQPVRQRAGVGTTDHRQRPGRDHPDRPALALRAPAPGLTRTSGARGIGPTPRIAAGRRARSSACWPCRATESPRAPGRPDTRRRPCSGSSTPTSTCAADSSRSPRPAPTSSPRASMATLCSSSTPNLCRTGHYSRHRPGGPTQYDLNISHPIDLSGKRRARTRGRRGGAQKVIEAQYQDAVRVEIANLYEAYLGAPAGPRVDPVLQGGPDGS